MVHPSPGDDEASLRLALRIAGRLVREERTTLGALKAAWAEHHLDPLWLLQRLASGDQPTILVQFGARSENDTRWRLRARTLPPLPFVDAVAVIDRSAPNVVQSTVEINGSRFEAHFEFADKDEAAIAELTAAMETATPTDPEYVYRSRDVLAGLLFPPDVRRAIGQVLDTARGVRLRLHPTGALPTWPWEIASYAGDLGELDLARSGWLALTRMVGSGGGRPLTDGRLDYACLTDELDFADRLPAVTRHVGWLPARRVDLFADPPAAPGVDVLVVVAHAEQRPELQLDQLGACDLRITVNDRRIDAEQLADAVAARRPSLVMLGICYSALENALTPSLARLLVKRGVAGAIGIRGRVERSTIAEFTTAFLDRVGLGFSPEQAVAAGRAAIFEGLDQRSQFVMFS